MARYIVGRVSEFTPGSRKIVTVAGRSIGVFFINGEFFAIRNLCPHAGAPLCRGDIAGLVRSSEPGHYDYDRRGEFIRCPWHGWEFDLRTGRSWVNPARLRARPYATKVVRGSHIVEEQAMAPAEAGTGDGLSLEIYSISICENYVQIEV
jgi:3-phenylpropionate/trans-cinnamate dioxygenase ferredoxin subunit